MCAAWCRPHPSTEDHNWFTRMVETYAVIDNLNLLDLYPSVRESSLQALAEAHPQRLEA